MKKLTAVAYAINGSGLGHLTRVLAILRWARRIARFADTQLHAYVLTTSEASSLAFDEGFPSFKIPSKSSIREAGMPRNDYLRLARQWVWHSLGLIDPDLLLVDTFPGGSFGELLHALDGPRSRVFVHRAMREDFANHETVQALLPLYDRILVPIEPDGSTQSVDPTLEERTHRVGPIMLRSREEIAPRAEARSRLGVPHERLAVWVSAGGGGDPTTQPTIELVVDVLSGRDDLHIVVGAGPLYRKAPVRGPNITWQQSFRAVEDFAGLDFAISAAGYNACHELLHMGVPTAFFAQNKVADEQEKRLRAAVNAGCAIQIPTDTRGVPTRQGLVDAIELLSNAETRQRLATASRDFVPVNFAREAAYEVLATLLPLDGLDEAMEICTQGFFSELERFNTSLDDSERVLRALERIPGLDGADRVEATLRLLESNESMAPSTARLFPYLASRLGLPSRGDETDRFVDACGRTLRSVLTVGDERASLAFLRFLPSNKGASPEVFADAIDEFVDALRSNGESIWRGMSVLSRVQGESRAELDCTAILSAAAGEIRSNVVDERELEG